MDYKDGLLPIINHFKNELEKNGWYEALNEFVNTNEFNVLNEQLIHDRLKGINIYPSPIDIFRALLITPVYNVKVIILGLDPYHTPGAANGLAFATNNKPQPSLKNIYKEVENNGFKVNDQSGNLNKWAEQGVLLINTSLTVQQGKPGSHVKYWEEGMIRLLRLVIKYHDKIVVMLWGKQAQRYDYLLQNYDLLTCPHPSPYSADLGFFGCKHFTKCNELLTQYNRTPIDWNLC